MNSLKIVAAEFSKSEISPRIKRMLNFLSKLKLPVSFSLTFMAFQKFIKKMGLLDQLYLFFFPFKVTKWLSELSPYLRFSYSHIQH